MVKYEEMSGFNGHENQKKAGNAVHQCSIEVLMLKIFLLLQYWRATVASRARWCNILEICNYIALTYNLYLHMTVVLFLGNKLGSERVDDTSHRARVGQSGDVT